MGAALTAARRPAFMASFGAVVTGGSSTLMHLGGTSGATTAFFRCAYAIPILILFALVGRRRGLRVPRDPASATSLRPTSLRATSLRAPALAGVLLSIDLIVWDRSIALIGAGLSTVVQDTQVVFVVLAGWLLAGERVSRRTTAAIPVILMGVALIAGVGAPAGDHGLVAGTALAVLSAVAYAGFIYLLRWPGGRGRTGTSTRLLVATSSAAITSCVVGAAGGNLQIRPAWPSAGWLLLLAISTQVFGWLIVASAAQKLTAGQASIALLLQPVAAVVYGAAFLGEAMTWTQGAGTLVVIAGVSAAGFAEARRPGAADTQRRAADTRSRAADIRSRADAPGMNPGASQGAGTQLVVRSDDLAASACDP